VVEGVTLKALTPIAALADCAAKSAIAMTMKVARVAIRPKDLICGRSSACVHAVPQLSECTAYPPRELVDY
jgi:hypothetical protein